MTGPESVDLPGALPTDSMRRGVEPASPTVDDSAIIDKEKYGQLLCMQYIRLHLNVPLCLKLTEFSILL